MQRSKYSAGTPTATKEKKRLDLSAGTSCAFLWLHFSWLHVELRRHAIRRYTHRLNFGGNFCGHNPAAPAFRAFSSRYADTHPLLRKAIELVGQYYQAPHILEQLGRIRTNGDRRSKRRDGELRRVRSEQRDINIKVMQYCLSKLNLFKLQVGIVPYSDFEGLHSPTEGQIASDLGESLIRVQRALAHWRHAGYISITPRRRKTDDGQWESISPIICIRKTLLTLIGISEAWLETTQRYVYGKWKQEREKRFQRAVVKQGEMQRAKNKAAGDFSTQELLRQVDGLRDLQRQARDRANPPNAPPPDPESPDAD